MSSLIGVELFGVIARHCGCTPAGFKGKCVFRCFHNPVYWFRALSPSSQGCLTRVPALTIPPLPTFDPLPSSYKNPVITLDLPTKSRIIALFFFRSQLMSIFRAPLAMFHTSRSNGFTGKHLWAGGITWPATDLCF